MFVELTFVNEKHIVLIYNKNIKGERKMYIKSFYEEVFKISDKQLLQLLSDATEKRHYRKGETLISTGCIQKDVYFLDNGILRGFYLDSDGHDITDCFITKYGMPAMTSLSLKNPVAEINIEALVDSDVFCLSVATVIELLENDLSIMEIYNQLLQSSLKWHWEAKNIISQKSGSECYKWFLKAFPDLINQISNKYIASF